MTTLRGGMVGAGVWSRNQLDAWREVQGAEITALCDRDSERLEGAARRYRIDKTFVDVETMLDECELDFIDVCTRPASHARIVRASAARGLATLCQKPFCTSLQEASETVEACAAHGARLMINENFRWQGWYRMARERLSAGKIGKPFFALIEVREMITMPRFDHPQRYFAEMPRLIVYEMGVHYFDVFRYLFGEPRTVYARLHHVSPDIVGDDVMHCVLGYPDMTAVVSSSWASTTSDPPAQERPSGLPGPPRMLIEGSAGSLDLDEHGGLQLHSVSGVRSWPNPPDVRPRARIAAQQHFIDCLAGGEPFETDGIDTLKTLKLVYAAYESAARGQAVAI